MAFRKPGSKKRRNLFIPAIALCVIFLVGAVWLFISSCSSASLNIYLSEHGADVQVAVDSIDSEGRYTFAYLYNDTVLYFTEHASQSYRIGETFMMRLNPSDPHLIFPAAPQFFLSFLLLALSAGSLFLCKKLRFLVRYLPLVLAAAALIALVSGLLLPYAGLLITGLIFLLLAVSATVLLRYLKKHKAK